jgi:DNA-binding MarR family transcriptional regulator
MPESPRTGEGAQERVLLELSQAQIDRVLRDTVGTGNMSVLFSGLAQVRETLESSQALLEDARLSRSLLCGLWLLAAFPADGSYVGNGEMADKLGMPISTAHRYIATLVAVGLVERDPASRRYRLANAG